MIGDESSTGSGGGFRSRLHYFLYSRKKKHVFAGIAIISVVFVIPLYFMTIATLLNDEPPTPNEVTRTNILHTVAVESTPDSGDLDLYSGAS
ncbi:hypothetical protein KSP40_PGU011544 [Platanthera guangdongensis]|uniref:Uncharacterized protein n=1 Tax=Platanthera guangdongensis TaxID=2320717 RepID=A0ABR2LIJ0_9ASPA